MITRRGFLETGTLAGSVLTLSRLLAAEAQASRREQSAKHCIFVFNYGGPSHIDTLDPKPEAPAEIRGEFQPIQTAVPGVFFSEHLPRVAAIADEFTLVRSVNHKILDHRQGAYYTLTGFRPIRRRPASPEDHPSAGSVLARLQPTDGPLPTSIVLPNYLHDNNIPIRGVKAGLLGSRYDPFLLYSDPNSPKFSVSDLDLRAGVSTRRMRERRRLLSRLAPNVSHVARTPGGEKFDEYREKAFNLLASPAVREAFDIRKESTKLRDRYGRTRYGQSLLLARRLVEAGTRLVTVQGGGPYPMDVWDTHQRNFVRLKNELLPPADQGLSALVSDLKDRGLLEETIVAWLGEFGRTPKIGATTVSSMNKPDGRDHWPHCYSVLLAGGGIHRGYVLGASDRIGAYPAHGHVHPEDLMATIYFALGIDPNQTLRDRLGQPIHLSTGKPIATLLS